MTAVRTSLLDLDDPDALDDRQVGRKAAALAHLRTSGFPVPAGRVLPVELCRTWRPGEDPPGPLAEAVSHITSDLPGPLAVRSSATTEDGRTRAAAGRHHTALRVEGTASVLAAVRAVLDSGPHGTMAVLLQPMLTPSHAGVAFTVDPLTGSPEVVRIAAVEGTGDALADGRVTGADVVVHLGGTVEGEGPVPRDQLRAVARMAREVALQQGCPQDLEWALVDGAPVLLQARPVTVVPVPPSAPPGHGWEKDVTHYPSALTPFGFSLLVEAEDTAIEAVFPAMGILLSRFEQHLAGGEVYTRPVMAIGPADPGPTPSPPPPAAVLGVVARIHPGLRRLTAAARRALATDLPGQWTARWASTWRPMLERRTTSLGAVELAALDDVALVAHAEALRSLSRDAVTIHFQLFMGYVRALHALHVWCREHLGWADARTATLLADTSPASADGEAALVPLRERIQAAPEAAEAVRADPEDPVGAIRPVDPDLADALQGWIEAHGWLTVDYDAGRPVLAERPTLVSRLLLSPTRARPSAAVAEAAAIEARTTLSGQEVAAFEARLASARDLHPIREENTRLTDGVVGGLWRRWLREAANRLVRRDVVEVPDDAAYLTREEVCGAIIGGPDDGLIERVVRRRGEEAWTRANPGPVTIGGSAGGPPDLSRLPAPLRDVNEPVVWLLSVEYPGEPEVVDPEGDVLLQGLPGSPGVVEGPVRVVHAHGDLDRLQPGEVLVCPVSTPAWATVFGLASAIVTDAGGVLSHAAIAAREHALPAVLATGGATATLVDGQVVRVDGAAGTVSRVS